MSQQQSSEAQRVTPAGEERQVQVRFVTKLPDSLRVPSSSFSVPSRLTRYGLSEVVNTLLCAEKPQPFDFLLHGELLRAPLEKILVSKKLSTESVLTLEYIPAVLPPEARKEHPHEDWVRAVSGAVPSIILTGSYDAKGRVLRQDGTCLQVLEGHSEAVTAVAVLASKALGGTHEVVTASSDQTLRLWEVSSESEPGGVCAAQRVFRGHAGGVESAAGSPQGTHVCSGSWDASIRIWPVSREPSAADDEDKSALKRRKVGKSAALAPGPTEVHAQAVLEGHAGCVAAVAWPHGDTVVSGSWDHSLRTWDTATAINTLTLTGAKAVYCVSVGGDGGALLAVGGADPVLRLWDPRSAGTAKPVLQLVAHSGWISSVAWKQGERHCLLSGSHDGTVRVWDTRTSIPLQTMVAHADKVLSTDWWRTDSIVSGGADCKLSVFS